MSIYEASFPESQALFTVVELYLIHEKLRCYFFFFFNAMKMVRMMSSWKDCTLTNYEFTSKPCSCTYYIQNANITLIIP